MISISEADAQVDSELAGISEMISMYVRGEPGDSPQRRWAQIAARIADLRKVIQHGTKSQANH